MTGMCISSFVCSNVSPYFTIVYVFLSFVIIEPIPEVFEEIYTKVTDKPLLAEAS